MPKRKNPAAASAGSRASREPSVASSTAGPTPKTQTVGLPPVGEDAVEDEGRSPEQHREQLATSPSTAQRQAPASAGTSFEPGASFFAPSDPTASASTAPESTPASSSFGFHPRDPSSSQAGSTSSNNYTATQATSFGAPTQPPPDSAKSPSRHGPPGFLSAAATSPLPPAATPLSSPSPTRGTAFSVPAMPPSQLSPSRLNAPPSLAAEPDAGRDRDVTPPLPTPPPLPESETAGPSRKRKAPHGDDGAEEPTSPQRGAKGAAKGKGKGKAPAAKRVAAPAANKRGKRSAPDIDVPSGEEGEEERGGPAPKGRVPAALAKGKGRGKARKTTRDGADEQEEADPAGEDEESEDEYDKYAAKQRARKPKQPKKKQKGAVDQFLFDPSDDGEGDQEEGAAGEEAGPSQQKRKAAEKKAPKKRSRRAVSSVRAEFEAEQGRADEMHHEEEEEEEGGQAAGGDETPPPPSPKPLPPVEPDETLMATLADPKPKVAIGRPSERTIFFEEREQRLKAERKEMLRRKREKMKRRKKGLPVSDDEDEEQNGGEAAQAGTPAPAADGGSQAGDEEAAGRDPFRLPSMGADDDEGDVGEGAEQFNGLDAINRALERVEGVAEAGDGRGTDEEDDGGFAETEWAPQMRIVDGQLVLDESSLQVERGNVSGSWALDHRPRTDGISRGLQQAQQIMDREVVEESAQDRFVNSASYGKKKGAARWSAEETELFYDVRGNPPSFRSRAPSDLISAIASQGLSQFYTNFEMIAIMFPHRSRAEIRRKFNREDKINPKLVTAALARRKRVGMSLPPDCLLCSLKRTLTICLPSRRRRDRQADRRRPFGARSRRPDGRSQRSSRRDRSQRRRDPRAFRWAQAQGQGQEGGRRRPRGGRGRSWRRAEAQKQAGRGERREGIYAGR